MKFIGPGEPFAARVEAPGDKSLSHRALFLAAMASGTSRISGLGRGRDVSATRSALRAVGVDIDGEAVRSPGVDRWRPPVAAIDTANSATTMRLLAGAVAGQEFTTTITGDASLMVRPMQRLVEPLRELGATVEVSPSGTPPISVIGGPLIGTALEIPIPSAQVRTASVLAAIQAEGVTTLDSPPGYRDHTERWLAHLGLGTALPDGRFEIRPGPVPALELALPGDPSAAAFLWVAAAIVPGARVETPGVSLNPGRTGILEALGAMGADVTAVVTGEILGDPVGDVTVGGAALRGIEVTGVSSTRSLDELPVLAIAAAHAHGPTIVRDAGELRTKESDRVSATVAMIRALDGTAEEWEDGFTIDGGRLRGGAVDARGDHRIAMAAAVAASAGAEVEIDGFDAVRVSWPGFAAVLEAMWSSR
ncbi:MAG TPA: 3-phosphoshikimate 1-carboxyvinyltransferase [Acidimicrobiia bacterium]|nr:3-phosphoshikimate 1-carboxyvinyltransferase [Acidimicrobiia bacterium]